MYQHGQRVRHINCGSTCEHLNKVLVITEVCEHGCYCKHADEEGEGYFDNDELEPIEEE